MSVTRTLPQMQEIFDMHNDMRLEMIMDLDVATALVTGVEKLKFGTTQKNQAYILAGGKKNGWQLRGKEFISSLFNSLSIPIPDKKYFTQNINTYHLDWYDTKEAQNEFNFQNHFLEDYFKYMKKEYRFFKLFIILFKKAILKKLVKMSPYQDKSAEIKVEK